MAGVDERRAYRVSGRVQGVGFRYFTRRAAEELGVAGWVRNAPDGTVESVAAGSAGVLDAFEERLRQGPRGSRVDAVEQLAPGELAGPEPTAPFRIVHS